MKKINRQINQYLNYCQNIRQMSESTIAAKRYILKLFVREVNVRDVKHVSKDDIARWIKVMSDRDVSARTINNRLVHVKELIRFIRSDDRRYRELAANIPELAETEPRRVFYNRRQIADVLDHCETDLEWLLISIAFTTGMRLSELASLSVEQIDGLEVEFIAKGNKPRKVYISDEIRDKLNDYLTKNHINGGYIWQNKSGGRLCLTTIRKHMRRAFRRCGYDDFYPHTLRHSFATDIQIRGADILEIKEMLGHSSVRITERYIHGLDNEMEKLFAKYR